MPRVLPLLLALGVTACAGGGKLRATPTAKAAPRPAAATPATAPEDVTSRAARAVAAFDHRDERAALEQAIASWEAVTASETAPVERLVSLSRAYNLLADAFLANPADRDQSLLALEKGMRVGERALLASAPALAARVAAGERIDAALAALPKESMAAAYWYGANLTGYALIKGLRTAVYYRERILAVLNHLVALDEHFLAAGPERLLATFYALAPSAAGGDLAKARLHFERALALAPNELWTRVVYAEQYAVKARDRELFTRLLGEATALDPAEPAELRPEHVLWQNRALQLLAKADDLF